MVAVTSFYKSQVERMAEDEQAARDILGQASMPEAASLAETASWVAVARVLLNTDEFITKE